METPTKKIVILSDSPFTNTGYSTQSLFLMNGLADLGYEIHFFAHNFVGQQIPPDHIKLADGVPFKFHFYGNGRAPYCQDVIVPKIQEIKPDYFIVLLDTFMLYPWALQQNFAPAKSIFWFPTDGGGRLPLGCENVLRKFYYPVAMSKFGQKQVADLHGLTVDYIPHGVDSARFHPLTVEEKKELKKKYNLSGKFVVGLVGRNQGRKMHDRAIKAFAKWCKPHEDAILLMHLDPHDNAAVFDMINMINEYGLQNRIRFTGVNFYQGFTYEKMNEIYNLMDIYFSSTSGEGFGVCTIEAMSCEVPVINTAYTTTDELVTNHKAGEPVKLVGTEYVNLFDVHSKEYDMRMWNGTITGSWSVERAMIDIDDTGRVLEKLYCNEQLRKEYGLNGRKAVLENYDWPIIIKKWHEVLQKI